MSSIEKVVKGLKTSSTESTGAVPLPRKTNQHEQTSKKEYNKRFVHIDPDQLQKHGIIVPTELHTKKAEEFRVIKRPLLQNAFGKGMALVPNGNLVMVTSSVPEEGKTTITLNLAVSMAVERDTTVLLVDCDVVNPSLSRFFKLQNHLGLTDVLRDSNISISDIIVNTDMPQLRLLPSGLPHSHSTELLASERMSIIVHELSQRYSDRVVLFDSPPLLLASQATVLSQLVGQIVMVVEAGRTPKNVVKEAVDLLDPDKVIGMILNKSRNTVSNYYGSYYGPSKK